MRRSPALAADIKPEFAFRVVRGKVNFAGRRVYALSDQEEMMDQLLHFREHLRLRRQKNLSVLDVDGTRWNPIQTLVQYPNALPHLLEADQIPIVTIPD